MQSSNPSFTVRFSRDRRCDAWGTARTDNQANKAIEAPKERRKKDCKMTRLGSDNGS